MKRLLAVCVVVLNGSLLPAADSAPSEKEAREALHRAVNFMRQTSASGGYLWKYSADLKLREGEGPANATTAWVQPPGTPTVGDALREAWQLCGDDVCRQAAVETAHALVNGQLESGGWDYRIFFDPQERKRYAYRVDRNDKAKSNVTTFDDDTTQSALRFLIRMDQALEFKDAKVHEAVQFALVSLLKAQYPNGGWPQRYSQFPDPAEYPVRKANYPETWPRTFPGADYRSHYTFNDNALATIIDTLFLASDVYSDRRFHVAAERSGDFILLAQMPDPQPAWAQQYNREMQPAWARKFEPPSVTGGESQGILQTLLTLYRRTGNARYLEPIPRAIDYLRSSELPGGRLARFYELRTNKPLYFTKDYQLTYSDSDLPTHYGFIVGTKLDQIDASYRQLRDTPVDRLNPPAKPIVVKMSSDLASRARTVIDALDARGAWVEKGELRSFDTTPEGRIIDVRTCVRNLKTLSTFLAAR